MAKKSAFKRLTEEYPILKSYRETYVEPRMKEIVQLVFPRYATFGPDPEWKDSRYDTIGTESATLRSKGFFSNCSPSAAPWFRYQFADPDKNKDKGRLKLLERLNEHMIAAFNRSTYYIVGPEWFQVACGFASSLDIREDKDSETIICTVDHPRSVYLKVNARNDVIGVYTRRFLTIDQIAEEFGEENLDADLRSILSQSSMQTYEFVDACVFRPEWKPNSPFNTDWKWGEYTFRPDARAEKFYYEGGAREFPKAVLREGIRGHDPYPYTPLDDAMPDIRTCNKMAYQMLEVKDKQANPATWYPREQPSWSTDAGSKHYYNDPNRWIRKDEIGSYSFDDKAHEFFHIRVRKALSVDEFLMLMQIETQMTAREVVERKREGMSVTSADLGGALRALDAVHARFLQIEREARRLDEFAELFDGSEIKVEYMGLLAQQQKQVYMESGIVGALQTEAAIFTLWPMEKFRIKPQVLTEDIWRANAAPEDALASDEEYGMAVQAFQQAQIQQQQAAIAAAVAQKADPMKKPEQGSPAESMMGQTG